MGNAYCCNTEKATEDVKKGIIDMPELNWRELEDPHQRLEYSYPFHRTYVTVFCNRVRATVDQENMVEVRQLNTHFKTQAWFG